MRIGCCGTSRLPGSTGKRGRSPNRSLPRLPKATARVVDPEATLARVAACSTLADFGRAAPFFLPGLYYYRAVIAHRHERDPATALAMYRGTIRMTQEVSRFSALSFLEPVALVWPARAQEAGIMLARGDLAFAADVFARLAAQGRHRNEADGFAVASAGYVDSVVARACEELFLRDRPDLARRTFEAWLTDLADRRAGIDWTEAATVERALGAAAVAGDPSDPVRPFLRRPARGRGRIGDAIVRAATGDPAIGWQSREASGTGTASRPLRIHRWPLSAGASASAIGRQVVHAGSAAREVVSDRDAAPLHYKISAA